MNQLGVAEEHYCTAATQLIMSQLYPYIFVAVERRGTAVASCVSGDLHELGARMVCDFLELDGWSTHFFGANMPGAGVARTVIDATEMGGSLRVHSEGLHRGAEFTLEFPAGSGKAR